MLLILDLFACIAGGSSSLEEGFSILFSELDGKLLSGSPEIFFHQHPIYIVFYKGRLFKILQFYISNQADYICA